MLKLSASSEPYWLDLLPDVRVKVRPITVASMLVAREAVRKVYREEDQADIAQRATATLVRELGLRGVVDWEGVGDAEGEPAPVTPENVGALLDVWQAYDAMDRLYVEPALSRGAEKNASANSLGGTSAGAPNTAPPAV